MNEYLTFAKDIAFCAGKIMKNISMRITEKNIKLIIP